RDSRPHWGESVQTALVELGDAASSKRDVVRAARTERSVLAVPAHTAVLADARIQVQRDIERQPTDPVLQTSDLVLSTPRGRVDLDGLPVRQLGDRVTETVDRDLCTSGAKLRGRQLVDVLLHLRRHLVAERCGLVQQRLVEPVRRYRRFAVGAGGPLLLHSLTTGRIRNRVDRLFDLLFSCRYLERTLTILLLGLDQVLDRLIPLSDRLAMRQVSVEETLPLLEEL